MINSMKNTWRKALPILAILGLMLGLTGCDNTHFNIGGTSEEAWSINLSGLPAALAIIGVVVAVVVVVVVIVIKNQKK